MIFDATDSALKKSLVSDVIEGTTGISSSADATAITINSSEEVSINTTTTFSNPLTTNQSGGSADSLRNQIAMTHTGASTAYHLKTVRAAGTDEPDGLVFMENTTERMRFRSDKATFSTSGANIDTFYNGAGSTTGWGGSTTGYFAAVRGGVATPMYISHSSTGSGEFLYFLQSTTTRGYVTWNGSTLSLVSTSDYRLKENVEPIANATTRINSLNPVSYNMIEDGTSGEGFLAHELQEHVPYAVTGTKDEVYTEEDIEAVDELSEDLLGTPKYQNVSYASLTPLLVKALQESNAEIKALKARIETLENA